MEPDQQPIPDEIYARLAGFFAANPGAGYRRDKVESAITHPWGDETLEFRISADDEKLIDTLNVLYLPPSLTGIWHRDSKELELIYYWIPKEADEFSRAFDFSFQNHTYKCEYARASDRLMYLVSAMRPVQPVTGTNFRNLRDLSIYQKRAAQIEGFATKLTPVSFWIKGLEWDDDAVNELARNLNFYMRYFDRRCPRVVIHVESPPESKAPVRYPFGGFPQQIIGRKLDPYLLGLWEAVVRASDPFRAYVYSYQILEYAAFYYLTEGAAQSVRRILSAPEFALQPELGTRQILDALAEFRSMDEDKIAAVVKQVADPAVLWREIQTHIDSFSCENLFEGDFCLPALVKRHWTLDDFRTSWHPTLSHSLRKLRNALVHGRESRTAKVVLPTRANYARVQPWIDLLYAIASQTVVYES